MCFDSSKDCQIQQTVLRHTDFYYTSCDKTEDRVPFKGKCIQYLKEFFLKNLNCWMMNEINRLLQINVRQKLKGQSRMDNPEKQDTR